MSANFVKVGCRDCGNEQVIFENACTKVACKICGATLAQPAGGKAKLVSAAVVEVLE